MSKMNRDERIKMVKAMEFICRQVNDEEVFEEWLMNGVADGDIEFGDLSTYECCDFDYYVDDENLAGLMETFLDVMSGAKRSGGLVCDDVVGGGDD